MIARPAISVLITAVLLVVLPSGCASKTGVKLDPARHTPSGIPLELWKRAAEC